MSVRAVVYGMSVTALAMAACVARGSIHAQGTSTVEGTTIDVRTTPVVLNPRDRTQTRIGPFTYVGGVEMRGVGTTRLHGLSDLAVSSDGQLSAVTDEGDFFEARLRLDARGRLIGISNGRLSRLVDLDGTPLRGKSRSDAEALAVLANGDRLIAFERIHRTWLYPAGGGRPVPAPIPPGPFPENEGIEAMAPYPFSGPTAYLSGSEGGTVWLCDTRTTCRVTKIGTMLPQGFALTALSDGDDDGSIALLGRSFDAKRGARAVVRLLGSGALERPRVVAEFALAAPLVRDNFEGLAIVRRDGGVRRVYLVSDDNFSASQHTYLLAFDWTPPAR